MNQYTANLRQLIARGDHFMKEIGDQWCTPDWLFCAVDHLYGPLLVDLFTDGPNSKCPVYFTADDNALTQSWMAALERARMDSGYDDEAGCFGNPPYSIKRAAAGRNAPHLTGMAHIMAKAYEEHCRGVRSVWIVKSATSEKWWPHSMVSQAIHINGRIGFDLPLWFDPDIEEKKPSGAGFGASILIFNGEDRLQQKEEYVSREQLMEIGMPIAKQREEARRAWIARFADL